MPREVLFMLMPFLLPHQLNYCARAETQESLLKLLLKSPPDLILFLETACADETWAEANEPFVHAAIEWVHQQFFQDQLMIEFAFRIAAVFRKHPSLAKLHLPNNLLLKLKDRDLPVNTLMYGSSSHYLKDLIRLECRDRKSDCIYLKDISYTVIEPIHEYIMRGYSESVYVKDKNTGENTLNLAQLWELNEFSLECQHVLKKWIYRDNAIDTLLTSHKKGWLALRSDCYDYINNLQLDARLLESPPETLKFEILRFSENSLQLFNQLRFTITHLVFGGTTTEQEEFSQIVNKCPQLIGIDLGYTLQFTDFLKDIPSPLEELELTSCPWLDQKTFNSMVTICPELRRLGLASNFQLNYQIWVVLQKLNYLLSLDLARCGQLLDEDIRLILESCDSLISLNLEECRGITDKGFSDISHLNPRLTSLNLSRTNVSDLSLIEIAIHCTELLHLNLTRCEKITDKGILEAVRATKKLKELIIVNSGITMGAVQSVKKTKPFLNIVN
jgi:F-box/leucine-rich repeat protein 2/20